ncbi:phospholipase A1-like isoform X2 [Zophobas morio]|uniref:phospholipase A1-like isoform X2 n=1 Tax=Zophobas morio TaxID=2755281 RepID=UPI003082F08C
MQSKVLFLLLTGIFANEDAVVDWTKVSKPVKQQIFNIYTGVAFVDKAIQGDKIVAENITYYLWATNKAEDSVIVNLTTFNPLIKKNAFYVFFLHGWSENKETEWYRLLRQAFFKKNPNYYIIEVDWSFYGAKDYIIASYDTKPVGRVIGEFVVHLHRNYHISLNNILIVGHSLGGQVAGFVGKTVHKLTWKKLPRIVALDPGGPMFHTRPKRERLNRTDAKVVQVIHTSGGVFGFQEACGTIDFFPNNGTWQPGCLRLTLLSAKDVSGKQFCSHWRSWKYFAEAVPAPKQFVARKCESWLKYTKHLCGNEQETMGNLKTTKRGKFYLRTNFKPPYSK